DEARHADPHYLSLPRYWVRAEHVRTAKAKSGLGYYYLAFRDVTSAVVLRTAIFAILPGVAIGHKAPIVVFNDDSFKSLNF
ncbi:MAG: hypothetical protein QME78_18340, partial [Thermodesulfobacteriota bacterium]|nr:hypothetical protein [Thermodesulfobacteriota bacterium]